MKLVQNNFIRCGISRERSEWKNHILLKTSLDYIK